MQIPGAYPRPDYGGAKHPLQISSPFQELDEAELLDILNEPPSVVGPMSPLISSTRDLLRSWLDIWIRSGTDADGFDAPYTRTFDGYGVTALHRAVQGVRVSWVPFGSSLVPWIDEPQNGWRFGSEREKAAYLLTLLLATDARFRIAKCNSCGRYFMLPERLSTYKTGTRCSDCRNVKRNGDATEATSRIRDNAEKMLLQIVVSRFKLDIQRSEAWFTNERLKERIAAHLNGKIREKPELRRIYFTAPRRGVTKKWVTRNRERIAVLVSTSAKTTKASIQGSDNSNPPKVTSSLLR